MAGLEPARLSPADFKSAVFTNFTTPATTAIVPYEKELLEAIPMRAALTDAIYAFTDYFNRHSNCRAYLMTVLLVAGFTSSAHAATFFFPDMQPTLTKLEPTPWLRGGKGNDAYVSITSQLIPTSSCTQLVSRNFWGSDKTQLILSVMTNGFAPNLNKTEIPIATFDGRDEGAACASLSTTPLQVVPMVRMGATSLFHPGNLSVVLNVKSSNDTTQDFIGPAKLLLGSAAIVASGGAAAAIGGVSATLGNPLVAETQTRTNTLAKGMIDARVPISLTWSELRQGLKAIDIPVYRTDQTLGALTDKKIQQLQRNPETDKELLFNVRFEFQYTRTLFYPTVNDIDALVEHENLSSERILNHKVPGASINFMQLLNDSSPSLINRMARSEGTELTRSCSAAFEKLKGAGLNNIDIAIVTKSFLDEARGSSEWYKTPTIVRSCFAQAPSVLMNLEKIYNVPTEAAASQ